MNNSRWVVHTLISIVIGVLIAVYFRIEVFEITILNILIAAIIFTGSLVVYAIVKGSISAPSATRSALSLPPGSVRAILALSVTVLFVFVAVLFFVSSNYNPDLGEKIITILGTLVIAICSFYFGTKATEQGSVIAQNVFRSARKDLDVNNKLNTDVILRAISLNRKKWIELYHCIDIKLGKKLVNNTQFEAECITFFVTKKNDTRTKNQIPDFLSVIIDGSEFSIPTDVQIQESSVSPSKVDQATLEEINSFKVEFGDALKSKHNADELRVTLKTVEGRTTGIPCLQFIVQSKFNITGDIEAIPSFFEYHDRKIPTDVKEESTPTEDSGSFGPGDSVRRAGTNSTGTIGLRVYRMEDGKKVPYLLSCYHVLCNSELRSGITSVNDQIERAVEAQIGYSFSKVGTLIEGEFGTRLDAAICRIDEGLDMNKNLKSFSSAPRNGIRILNSGDVENQMSVFTYGAVTKSISGTVLAQQTERKIKIYGQDFLFSGIIPVTKISVPGDSGALVVDDTNRTLGIIFASNSTTSYIIPISEIILQFKIQIDHA